MNEQEQERGTRPSSIERVPNEKLTAIANREEVLFLSLLLKDLDFMTDAVESGFSPLCFQNEVPRRIFEVAAKHYGKFKTRLTRQSMESILASTTTPEDAACLQSQYDAIFAEYIRPNSGEYGMFKKNILDRHAQRQAYATVKEYAERLLKATGGQQEIVEQMQAKVAAIRTYKAGGLPRIVSARALVADEKIVEPKQVIMGVLHKGGKGMYGGPSKAFKSWSLIDACVAVATGGEWLGFRTTRGRVLYVNMELPAFASKGRIQVVSDARGVEVPEWLDVWNLRGHALPLPALLDDLKRTISAGHYDLIVPDPIYKVLAGRAENSNEDIGAVCDEIERLAVQMDAAVLYGHHFAKGNASAKDSIDRVSGAGTWARDPDAIITATPHEEDDCFTVNVTVRNFQQPEPFVVRWDYPRMVRDETLHPESLRQPKNGRQASNKVEDIMARLGGGMATAAWQKKVTDEDGMTRATFYRLFRAARDKHLIRQTDNGLWTSTVVSTGSSDTKSQSQTLKGFETRYQKPFDTYDTSSDPRRHSDGGDGTSDQSGAVLIECQSNSGCLDGLPLGVDVERGDHGSR